VDRDGQSHSFTDANSTWVFDNPIQAIDLVEKYKDVLANVAMELKLKKLLYQKVLVTDSETEVSCFLNKR
jgi:hypothetical protein